MTSEEKVLWKEYLENNAFLNSFINKSKELQSKLRKLKSEIFKNIKDDFFEDKTAEIDGLESEFSHLKIGMINIKGVIYELEDKIGIKNINPKLN